MRAAAFAEPGGPEVLKAIELPTPTAGPGTVRVRVHAAGVQPYDCAVRCGWKPPAAEIQLPQVLGNEFAGVVDQVGEGVESVAEGDEVIGWAVLSCYAEYLVVSGDQCVPKPVEMPWPEAGALSGGGQTAHTALEALGVRDGQTLLIHAAAGGVGTVAVQLAVARGATVIGTASERNHEYLRSLGAIPLTYGEGLVERVRAVSPDGVDAVLDGIGGDAPRISLELVEDPQQIATLVAFEAVAELGIRAILSQRSTQRLGELTDLYREGKLVVHVSESYPLERAADAHRASEGGHVRGKLVIVP